MRILILITLIVQSCTLIPCGSYSDLETVNSKPLNTELTGIYLPDQQTIENIKGFSSNSKMILTKDNKFTFENFPESSFDFDAYYGGKNDIINGIGTWIPVYSNYTAELSVSVDYGDLNEDGKYDFGTSWQIFKKDEKYTICIIVGDPDACAVIRLTMI